jgi:hypothetical protein
MSIRGVVSVLIIALALISLFGSAIADTTIPGNSGSSALRVTTSAGCSGNLINQEELSWLQTTGNLSAMPPLGTGCVGLNIVGYGEHTMAVGGNSTYEKVFDIDTGNKTSSQDNLFVEKIVTFDATEPGGRMTSSEDVMVETISTGGDAATGCSFGLSPFGDPNATHPAENSRVTAGSSMDVTEVSAHTSATARTVSATTDTVEMTYSINARGLNQTPGNETPAIGSASAFVDADIMTGNDNSTSLGTDVSYHDVTSVDGLFELAKEVSYQSGGN